MMEYRALADIESIGDGRIRAVFARIGTPDHYGDILEAGAVGEQTAMMRSWDHGDGLPLGDVRIYEDDDRVIADMDMYMDLRSAVDTYYVLSKRFERKIKQGWSHGFTPDEWHFSDDGQTRYLDKITIHEVSPVMRPAQPLTSTLEVRSLNWRKLAMEHLRREILGCHLQT